jgi:hypothetical protein
MEPSKLQIDLSPTIITLGWEPYREDALESSLNIDLQAVKTGHQMCQRNFARIFWTY